MGSRRGRYAALALVAALGGCTAGAPTGFSGGDHWSVPLIGPLEDGLLLVPVFVDGQGPLIFALDPDANVSIVDEHVVKLAKLRTGPGPHMLDETDTLHPHFYAEVLNLELGTLTVERKSALIVKDGTYDADGRHIDGVIGRDVIADSLVFEFDRDLGVMTLTTVKAWHPSGEAIKYESVPSTIPNLEVPPPPRRLIKASINGQTFAMHIDLGAKLSQLRERSWDKAGIAKAEGHAITVDETGTARTIKLAGKAEVGVATSSTKEVVFAPYADDRWPDQDLEGALGLDFFRPYSVAVSWDATTLYLKPRRDIATTLAARIGRWQSKTLGSCQHPGCVTISVIDPLANVAPEQRPAQHPGVVVSFVREPAAAGLLLEVTASTTSPTGAPLPWLVANLPGNVERAMLHLPAEYVGAQLTVVDASEFPRDCPGGGSCVDLLTPPIPPGKMPAP